MNSIYRKLVVYFLLLNLFAIGAVGGYSYYKEKEALLSRTFDQLISVRIEKKDRITEFFQQRLLDLDNIFRLPHLQILLQSLAKQTDTVLLLSHSNGQMATEKKLLFSFLNSSECYSGVIYFNADCVANYISLDEPYHHKAINNKAFKKACNSQQASKNSFIEEIRLPNGNSQTVLIAGKNFFNGNGKWKGALFVMVNSSKINEIMYENNPNNGLNKTGEVYLVGSDSLMRSNSRFFKNSVFKTKVSTKGALQALKGITGFSQIHDYRKIPVLSAYSPLDFSGIHWAVLAEIDTKEAMIPIYSIRDNIIYLSLLIALISAAFITFISRRISEPLVKLKNETKKIARGQYGNTLTVETTDETGQLTKSFNDMSLQLKAQAEKIENEKKLRLRSVIDAQEKERQRLSRELHDGLGPQLLTGKMKLESALEADKKSIKTIIGDVMLLFSNIIREIRNISNDIMPSGLKELGLAVALQNLCQQVTKNHPVKINCLIDLKQKRYDKTLEIYLFRITQEAMNNTLKHAHANTINLNIEEIENHLYFSLQDDGCGFNKDNRLTLSGNGLLNIKERVNLLNGYFDLITSPGKGTRIDIEIPL